MQNFHFITKNTQECSDRTQNCYSCRTQDSLPGENDRFKFRLISDEKWSKIFVVQIV